MSKRWDLRDTIEVVADPMMQRLQVHPLVIGILAARGCATSDEVRTFLAPSLSEMLDPFLLLGMDMAVARLMQARRSGEKICIYGDKMWTVLPAPLFWSRSCVQLDLPAHILSPIVSTTGMALIQSQSNQSSLWE